MPVIAVLEIKFKEAMRKRKNEVTKEQVEFHKGGVTPRAGIQAP